MSTELRGWWQRRDSEEAAAVGPVNPQAARATCELASADEAMPFTAHFVFWPWWGGSDRAPESLWDVARSGIIRRAEKVSTQYRLTATERVRSELNAALLPWQPVGESHVHARGVCVSVTADPELVEAVAVHEKGQRLRLVTSWTEQRRRQQREQLCSLLLDPLQATAWWLLENPDKSDELVSVAQMFREVQSILTPPERSQSAGTLLDELLETKDDAVRVRVIMTLRKFFLSYEREDLAARLSALEE